MNKVNYNTLLLVIILFLFGIAVGIHLDSDVRVNYENLTSPLNKDLEAEEVTKLKDENQLMREKIKAIRQTLEAYEKEVASDNLALKRLKDEVNHYQLLAGHRGAEGTGISITIEGIQGENIAEIMESKKYLISLINELRFFGAEVLSINDLRLTARSEVTLAGHHINVNGKPIAPPYQIKAIGNQKEFENYIQHGTLIFDSMTSDGIQSNIQFEDNIQIPAIQREKPIEFLEPVKETNES